MKFGVNTMVWTTQVTEKQNPLFARIKKWGFDGVEPFITPSEPANIPALRATLDKLGLERTTCAVMPRDANLVSYDAALRANGVEFIKKCVERTAELGGSVICGPMHSSLGVMTGKPRTEKEWNWAVKGLQSVAKVAEKHGVTVCVEPLNRFETYFLNTLADGAKLVKAVGSPNVKIHFDTFHSNIEEKLQAEALRSVAKYVGHVHISENDRGIPGTGHNDWKGVFKTLKESGYKGWLTIESFAQPEPALAAAAAIWRDPAPSGDILARQGLRFMQGLAHKVGIRK
jgi:D-psicose/D-tagatose/L-ribulose 3-epimerase